MTFKGGKFTVEWMTLPKFDAVYAAQQETLRRASAPPTETSAQP
jgi:hypothetical protein